MRGGRDSLRAIVESAEPMRGCVLCLRKECLGEASDDACEDVTET